MSSGRSKLSDKPQLRELTTLEKSVAGILTTTLMAIAGWTLITTQSLSVGQAEANVNISHIQADLRAITDDINRIVLGSKDQMSLREMNELRRRVQTIEELIIKLKQVPQ